MPYEKYTLTLQIEEDTLEIPTWEYKDPHDYYIAVVTAIAEVTVENKSRHDDKPLVIVAMRSDVNTLEDYPDFTITAYPNLAMEFLISVEDGDYVVGENWSAWIYTFNTYEEALGYCLDLSENTPIGTNLNYDTNL